MRLAKLTIIHPKGFSSTAKRVDRDEPDRIITNIYNGLKYIRDPIYTKEDKKNLNNNMLNNSFNYLLNENVQDINKFQEILYSNCERLIEFYKPYAVNSKGYITIYVVTISQTKSNKYLVTINCNVEPVDNRYKIQSNTTLDLDDFLLNNINTKSYVVTLPRNLKILPLRAVLRRFRVLRALLGNFKAFSKFINLSYIIDETLSQAQGGVIKIEYIIDNNDFKKVNPIKPPFSFTIKNN